MYCGVNEREPSLGDTRPVAELEVAIEVEVAVAVEVEVAVAGAVAANPEQLKTSLTLLYQLKR